MRAFLACGTSKRGDQPQKDKLPACSKGIKRQSPISRLNERAGFNLAIEENHESFGNEGKGLSSGCRDRGLTLIALRPSHNID